MNSQLVQLGLAALAFLIALWLVVVIVRMLMGGRLRLPGGRTRQARLGIVDAFDLDRQRQLIIVRRDNTEHLIMIGGPNDVVIESEIVRVESRDFRDARRDKNLDGFTDMRVPAPIVSSPGDVPAPGNGSVPRQDEPLLPMALPTAVPPIDVAPPVAANIPVSVEPQTQRPTFPLPPRRPTPPAPERRPPPLPERVSRVDEPNLDAPSVAPPSSPPPPPRAQPTPPPSGGPAFEAVPFGASEPAPDVEAPSLEDTLRPKPPRPTPFLKPLSPRVPPRPLKRVTPQLEPIATAPSDRSDTLGAVRTSPASPPVSPPTPRMPPPAQPAAETAKILPDETDGLASLEEEMAKLLGR